jgi:hypothetical protein
MSRLIVVGTLAALTFWLAAAGAQDGKTPSVKEVMKKLNAKDAALCPTLGKALKADAPNWDEVQQETRVFLVTAEALAKNDPPHGDRASWTKLTTAYIADAREMDSAAQKKDRNAALAAHAKLANPATCNGCHKMHKN